MVMTNMVVVMVMTKVMVMRKPGKLFFYFYYRASLKEDPEMEKRSRASSLPLFSPQNRPLDIRLRNDRLPPSSSERGQHRADS